MHTGEWSNQKSTLQFDHKALVYSSWCLSFALLSSGDPRQDMEYERQLHQQTYIVPEPIKNFLSYFQKVVAELNTIEIGLAYENG